MRALLNKQISQLSSDLEKERIRTSARPWTKAQFDVIQEIKGVVKDVGVISQQHCAECDSLAMDIEIALNAARAKYT